MAAHPGIIFKPGPSGRRPAVIGGPDVREVISTLLNPGAGPNAEIDYVAEFLGLTACRFERSGALLRAVSTEIDDWIRESPTQV